jgi:hypothetical protein
MIILEIDQKYLATLKRWALDAKIKRRPKKFIQLFNYSR